MKPPCELNNLCLTTAESRTNTMHLAAVRSKAVILLLWIHCLLLLPLFVGVLCSVFILLFSTLCPSSFAIILMVKRELVALL